jgi:DNA-binding transcriptional MerR regulator
MAHTPTSPFRPKGFIGIKEAASFYSVSVRTFRRWAELGVVPKGVRLRGRRLWRLADIERHIQTAE